MLQQSSSAVLKLLCLDHNHVIVFFFFRPMIEFFHVFQLIFNYVFVNRSCHIINNQYIVRLDDFANLDSCVYVLYVVYGDGCLLSTCHRIVSFIRYLCTIGQYDDFDRVSIISQCMYVSVYCCLTSWRSLWDRHFHSLDTIISVVSFKQFWYYCHRVLVSNGDHHVVCVYVCVC